MPRAPPRNQQYYPRRPLKDLQPAPPPPPIPQAPPTPPPGRATSFLDLPAELRLEIYHLALKNVTVHIMPSTTDSERPCPHALLRTNHQVRSEVAPIIYSSCPIRATITDFDFSGLLTWLHRIPSDAEHELKKNPSLSIRLCTTHKVPGDLPTLRRWLHHRADICRPQADWKYTGPTPSSKIANDLRRRLKRMKEARKQAELRKMVKAIGVCVYGVGGQEAWAEGERREGI